MKNRVTSQCYRCFALTLMCFLWLPKQPGKKIKIKQSLLIYSKSKLYNDVNNIAEMLTF